MAKAGRVGGTGRATPDAGARYAEQKAGRSGGTGRATPDAGVRYVEQKAGRIGGTGRTTPDAGARRKIHRHTHLQPLKAALYTRMIAFLRAGPNISLTFNKNIECYSATFYIRCVSTTHI
ncbi:MAG: hypothetical protein HLUCCA01_09970 [Bacteroidetes bacterium HLUCCA01]|nr:MAG: hypothetical protein HLUCCA01_09970 [Bacteroidetes bacterium HLUCCA01]